MHVCDKLLVPACLSLVKYQSGPHKWFPVSAVNSYYF